MTTQITAKTYQSYECPLFVPYTGTSDQPDTVSLFCLQGKGPVCFRDESIHNQLDYNPLNFMIAIARIQEAGYRVFLYMKGEDNDLWNACKNLTRGVVALVPLAGNGVLYLYDTVKTNFYIHPQITEGLKTGPAILGIAFDGKIVTTFPLEKFNTLTGKKADDPLGVLAAWWLMVLKENIPNKLTRIKLAERLTSIVNGAAR